MVNADLASDGAIQAFHNSRMLRYNAVRLWQNLLRQGWSQVPPPVVIKLERSGP